MKWTVRGLFILVALLCMQTAHANCNIIVNNHAGTDSDCDSIPDQYDNCPTIANQDQRDTNHNGIGDACDSIISDVTIDPSNQVAQGDFAHITVRVLNNQPLLDNVNIQLQSKELAVNTQQSLSGIPNGETSTSEFWIKIPKCQKPSTYNLTILAISSELKQSTTITLTVLKGNVCGTPSTTLDDTIISTIERAEIDRGQTASIPIRIQNLGNMQGDYTITLNDVGNLGTWSINPQTQLPIAAGNERTVMLSLETQENIDPGTRHLQLTITSDGKNTTVPFDLYVRAPIVETTPINQHASIQVLFIIALIVLIIAAVITALRTHTIKTHYVHTEKPVEKIKRRGKAISIEDAEDPKKKTNY